MDVSAAAALRRAATSIAVALEIMILIEPVTPRSLELPRPQKNHPLLLSVRVAAGCSPVVGETIKKVMLALLP